MKNAIIFNAFITWIFLISYGTASQDWDMIIFSQEWPITTCIDHVQKHPSASCNLYRNMTGSWTIHGLWPTKIGTRGPTFCNSSYPFIESQIINLENNLVRYWTNIYADQSRVSLWQHEWDKHGTCAASLPELRDEMHYFSQGLKWIVNYNLEEDLRDHGIVPGAEVTYANQQLLDALASLFGTDKAFVVDCIYDTRRKRHLLSQIKICFDKNLEMISCAKYSAGLTDKLGNCPNDGIYYPSTVKHGNKVFRHGRKQPPSLPDSFYSRRHHNGVLDRAPNLLQIVAVSFICIYFHFSLY